MFELIATGISFIFKENHFYWHKTIPKQTSEFLIWEQNSFTYFWNFTLRFLWPIFRRKKRKKRIKINWSPEFSQKATDVTLLKAIRCFMSFAIFATFFATKSFFFATTSYIFVQQLKHIVLHFAIVVAIKFWEEALIIFAFISGQRVIFLCGVYKTICIKLWAFL